MEFRYITIKEAGENGEEITGPYLQVKGTCSLVADIGMEEFEIGFI